MRPKSGGAREAAKRSLHVLTVLALCAAAAGFIHAHLAVAPGASAAEPPVFGSLPDFTLTDSSSRPFTRRDAEGRVWIADFIFTRCAGQCLVMSSQMASLAAALPDVGLLSFSVDPDYDTPERLAEYAKRYDAPERWRFLTGDVAETGRITVALGMGPLGEPLLHTTRLVLVDAAGRARGFYDANDEASVDRLVTDARTLVAAGARA